MKNIEADKELLLQDLCARLSYGVKLWHESFEDVIILHAIDATQFAVEISIDNSNDNTAFWNSIEQVKPYLFPLSSMTVAQQNEFTKTLLVSGRGLLKVVNVTVETYDWLNKNHFDCRGLIPKGLAIDCTNLNIY